MQSTLDTLKRYYVNVKSRHRGCMALRDSTFFIGAAAAAGAAGLAALCYVSASKAEGQTSAWDYLFSYPATAASREHGTGSDEPPAPRSTQASLGQLPSQLEDEPQAKQIPQIEHDAAEADMCGTPVACPASSNEQLAVNGEFMPHVTQQQVQEEQPQRTAPLLNQEQQQQQQQQQEKEEDVVDSQHPLQHDSVDLKQQVLVQEQEVSHAAVHSNVAVDAAPPKQTPEAPEQQQQQARQLERQSSSFKQQLSEWELRVSSPTAAAAASGGTGGSKSPALSLSPRAQQQQQQDNSQPTTQQQQQQQEAVQPAHPSLLTPTRRASVDSNWSASSSTPATPNFAGLLSSSSMKQRTPINATRKGPSLDSTVSSAAVAHSLQTQYVDDAVAAAAGAAATAAGEGWTAPVRSLATTCAVLCEQHCIKLQDISGELGETTALEIGCGTGGSCFQLALSFSHVLGLDGDPLHVVAAKEMKEKGQLEYHPLLDGSKPGAAASAGGGASSSSSRSRSARRVSEADGLQLHHDVTCLAMVPDDIDRDKVRFWSYPLPDLPPKLQPVDAVLVEDVTGRLGPGLGRVLQQIPALLNPQGVCVVVLDGSSSSSSSTCNGGATVSAAGAEATGTVQQDSTDARDPAAATALAPLQISGALDMTGSLQSMEQVKHALQQQGLRFLKEQHFKYPVMGSTELRAAHAGVWLQQ